MATSSTPEMPVPRIRAPSNLPSLVETAFNRARTAGDLTYYPTQVTILHANNVPFQLRFSPSLFSKPKAPVVSVLPTSSDPKPAFISSPFLNPHANLLVSPLGGDPPSHNLILNKFAIVPEHFILSTAEYKPQTHLLEESDVEAAYACISAYYDAGKDLFVFYNSGPHSGASQPHRHLQLLPVEKMRDGLEDGTWSILADHFLENGEQCLFWTAGEKLSPDITPRQLRDIYIRLYGKACEKMGVGETVGKGGEATISYNLAMTRDNMVLCPRTKEGGVLRDEEGNEVGMLALNGTALAGTALVKTEKEWEVLRKDPGQLVKVLEGIGARGRL